MEPFFQSWSADHKFYIISMAALWVLVPFLSNKYLGEDSVKKVALLLVVSIIGLELVDDIYRVFDERGWFIASDLPLHMCGFSVFATSWALITKNQTVFELSYFWGFGGALQAILTPDPSSIVNHFYLFSFSISCIEFMAKIYPFVPNPQIIPVTTPLIKDLCLNSSLL